MTRQVSRRQFIANTGTLAIGVSTTASMDVQSKEHGLVEFNYGVASGDPLTDAVIIWTHAKAAGSNQAVKLRWEMSSDESFKNIVQSGSIQSTNKTGFTAKVDVLGLQANTTYFYRFVHSTGVTSKIGTTRTLPHQSSISDVVLAVFSCSLYSAGFFNAYDHACQSDAQFAVHLGDYIYEYGASEKEYGNSTAQKLSRITRPSGNLVSLQDYRTRYALYRSDPSLQALHAKMPWITVWDDHEFANNAFVNGAENHNDSKQGSWSLRKATAAKVYHEWMPIRTPDSKNLYKIFRKFDFGRVLTLQMIDTRIEGRAKQYANFGELQPGYSYEDYFNGLNTKVNGLPIDAQRGMISTEQMQWIKDNFSASKATWQMLGNQDVMGKMWMPSSVLKPLFDSAMNPGDKKRGDLTQLSIQNYLAAKATKAKDAKLLTPEQMSLLNVAENPRLPFNLDAWDGYPMNRELLLQIAKSSQKNLIVISGDSHNAWFNSLTTLSGEKVGFEFAGTSVTSPGFESFGLGDFAPLIDGRALMAQFGPSIMGAGLGLIDDVHFAETQSRGYLKLTASQDTMKGEYIFLSTVLSKDYTAKVGTTITVAKDGTVVYT